LEFVRCAPRSIRNALTAQHVIGPKGTEVLSAFDTDNEPLRPIGEAAGSCLVKRPFEAIYPTLPGPRSLLNLDVGLLEMPSVERWSSDMRELGSIGSLIDFNDHSASLDWIRRRIVGFGAASGIINGEIWALFYRYLNVAGVDYIADVLVGGRDGVPLALNPGDSGTLLCIAREEFEQAASNPEETAGAAAAADPPLIRPFAVL